MTRRVPRARRFWSRTEKLSKSGVRWQLPLMSRRSWQSCFFKTKTTTTTTLWFVRNWISQLSTSPFSLSLSLRLVATCQIPSRFETFFPCKVKFNSVPTTMIAHVFQTSCAKLYPKQNSRCFVGYWFKCERSWNVLDVRIFDSETRQTSVQYCPLSNFPFTHPELK